jgi:hypothetical protein
MKKQLVFRASLALLGTVVTAAPRASVAATHAGASDAMRYGAAILQPGSKSNSGASGALMIMPDITGLRLALHVAGLRPRTAYNALIYAGSCGATGDVRYILPDLTTDSRGRGTLITTLHAESVPASAWAFSVPLKQKSEAAQPGPGIVCGNVHQVGVDIPVVAPDVGRYKAEGLALLTRHITKQGAVDTSKALGTEIAVYGDRLSPHAAYAVQINLGRCGGTGAVKYRLSGLETDARGEGVEITYLSGEIAQQNQEDLALNIVDGHGSVATCGNFPGYGLTQPEQR